MIRRKFLNVDLVVWANEHIDTNIYSNGGTGFGGKDDHVVHDAFINSRKIAA